MPIIAVLLYASDNVYARNPNLSYWTLNLSESASPTAPGEHDFAGEIAVVGTTVHVMWLTQNADYSGHKLYYRRSTDNGVTWEPKQLLFESDDLVTNNTYRRMAVSGNYVHIAVSHYEGSWYGVLTYCRSINNGASFEAPRNIFTAPDVYHVLDVYVTAAGANVTIGFRNQCNWKVDNAYILKISTDNGDTFTDHTAYSTTTGANWRVSDMQRVGDNIYVLYTDSDYYNGLLYSRLYVASSANAGGSFTSAKISLPSKDGQDKTSALQDEHYVPKIAGVDNTVSVIWSGLDSNDVLSVFHRGSTNSGGTWGSVHNFTAGVTPGNQAIQPGTETLAAKGTYVYALILTTSSKVYLRRSTNSGYGFLGFKELTAATDTPYIADGWWPVIQIDPAVASGAKVHVLWDWPKYCYSTDGGVTFVKPELVSPYFSYHGALVSGANQPYMAIGADGKVHFVVQARYYCSSLCGGYCDFDIFYRGFTGPPAPTASNMALRLVSNGDDDRYDNMQVRASSYMNFTYALTGEVWVKPYPGGETTGTTSYIKPIFHKTSTTAGVFSYALQTCDRYGQRQAQAQILTTDGTFWLNPASATEGLVPDGVWTHLAFSYNADGGADNFKLYMNGQLIATTTATGNLVTGDGLFFTGKYGVWEVDELRLWNVARTQAQIVAGKNHPLTGTEPGLNAYYNFNNTTKDITGHGNNGILMYMEEFVNRGGNNSAAVNFLLFNEFQQ